MPTPDDLEVALGQHGAGMRQLAGALLRDSADAEDAVQDVWLSAVRRPPAAGLSGPWFATALRNMARKLRRGSIRRQRREQAAAVVRATEQEDHTAELAREEQLHRLVAAVTALDPVYRDAIWKRYFEGLTPADIARSSEVPLATVKSRLQRGLQQLRQTLGRDRDVDWRAALGAAFGIKISRSATAAVVAPGALSMTIWTKMTAAIAVGGAACALFWPWSEVEPSSNDADDEARSASLAKVDDREPPHASSPERAAAAAAVADTMRVVVAETEDGMATLIGRCVDERGAPLAGCRVLCSGQPRSAQAIDTWVALHGAKPVWNRPAAVVTTADGRFSFSFRPLPPFQFSVRIHRPGSVAMEGRWSSLAPSSHTDVGDVTMHAGIEVTGRVVDAAGKPVPRIQVDLARRNATEPRDGVVTAVTRTPTRCHADGSFEMRALPPGDYDVIPYPGSVQTPKTVSLSADRAPHDFTIVLASPTTTATITGHVLDATDAPVRGVTIMNQAPGSGLSMTMSRRDGTFELKRSADDRADRAQLGLMARGYDFDDAPRELAWGSTDVVFRLTRGGQLTLRLTDPDQRPIDSYAVRLVPMHRKTWSSDDGRVRAFGNHADGTAVLKDLTRGDWLLMVEFPEGSPYPTLFHEFAHVRGARRLDLSASLAAERTVRIVDADGQAVVGTKVQLCEPFGAALEAGNIVPLASWLMNGPRSYALALSEHVTDAEGRCLLRGAAGRDLGIHVHGSDHVPQCVSNVRLESDEELVVRVEVSARLRGRIVPPAALLALKRLAGLPADGGFTPGNRPRLQLVNTRGGRFPAVAGSTAGDIGDDGSFDIGGVPPGEWLLSLMAAGRHHSIGQVTMTAGQTTTRNLELGNLIPGTVVGRVLHNGKPLTHTRIRLSTEEDGFAFATDGDGRLRASLSPGEYRLCIPGATGAPSLWCATTVRVVGEQTTTQTFSIDSSTLQVKVLDPNGQPIHGVRLYTRSSWSANTLPQTDADGLVECEHSTANVTLRVLPKALTKPGAILELWQNARPGPGGDIYAGHWIDLRDVTLSVGETTAIEVRLPARAGY